jgi:hypothetical protein
MPHHEYAYDKSEKFSAWHQLPFVNLIRYQSSEIHSARIKGKGKLIRRSLHMNPVASGK